MKKLLPFLLILAASVSPLAANVVRPAPDVTWVDVSGKRQGLAAFKGQPIILIIAESPRAWIFRSQVGQLQKMYQRFAADRLVCLAAFTQEPGLIRSNIPFVQAADGPRAAYDYQAGKFALAVIGRDGNLDYVTDRVVPAQRLFDIIGASFVNQAALRTF